MEQKKKSISLSVLISLLTLVVSFLTSFIFTRFLLTREQIGDVNYGLKTTADSFVSFVSIFTVGMSSTFIRFHKKYANEEKDVFSAFTFITSIISLIAIIFGIVLFILTINNKILDPSGGVYTQQQVNDFAAILVISISYIALSVVLGNSKWFLESTKNIVLVRVINLIVVTLYPVISTIFVLIGANMVAVTLIYSIVYLAGFLSYLFFRIRKTKTIKFLKIGKLKKDLIKEIVFFSFFVVLTSSIETFNHSIDKLVLTVSLQAASLTTIYQLSITLNQVLLSLADIIYAPFLPYIAEDVVSNNQEGIQKTYNKVNLLLLLLSFLIFTGFAACGKEFVYIWVGEGKEIVYYFATILFAIWPLYGMIKFSNSIQRLSAKHYKSTILFVISFILHIGITFSFVKLIGIWSCIIGTASGHIFLGISFIFYNKKYLKIKQNSYLKNLLLLSICSAVSIAITFLVSFLIKKNIDSISSVYLFLIEGVLSVSLFALSIAIIYWKKVKKLLLTTFNDSYSISHYGHSSYLGQLKSKLSQVKDKINKSFPFIFILYFVFNFASYYLGGLEFMSAFVSSSAFTYISKLISYFILIAYGTIFALANNCRIKQKNVIFFVAVFSMSILSAFVVPKTVSFVGVNEYRWTVLTTFNLGIKDLIIGNINWLIDLIVMFFYLYIFRQAITRNDLVIFMKFVVSFALLECLYTFIFQYKDYLYFFSKASGATSFNGYTTNLSGTFSSKNGFGFLLFQSIIACFYLMLYDKKIKPALYWIPFAVLNIINIFTLCKTSALASIVFDLFIFASWLNKKRKNNFKVFLAIFISLIVVACFIGLCFTPFMRKISFINSVINKINEVFFVSGNATIRSRIILWEYALKLVKGPYLILGYGKTASSYFLNVSSNFVTHTFHNGILDILCSYGIFGVILYFYGIRHSFIESTKNTNSSIKRILIVAIIVTTLLYGFMENVYLLISSSSTMLVSNVILSVSSDNVVDTNTKKELGEYLYDEINI